MDEKTEVNKAFGKIADYFFSLEEDNDIVCFFRKQLLCVDDSLNLIELSLLPLPEVYIAECRKKVRDALKQDNFLDVIAGMSILVKYNTFEKKKFREMTTTERAVFSSFLFLFPVDIEPDELHIESFYEKALGCDIDAGKFLLILQKHFGEIITTSLK